MRGFRVSLLLVTCAGALATAQNNPLRVVLVGIQDFPQDPQVPGLQYAINDAGLFGDYARSGATLYPVDSRAGYHALRDRLSAALLEGLRPGERPNVLLFVSSQGTARSGSKDGMIHTWGSSTQKPESNSFRVSELSNLILRSRANAVFVLADLSRNPPPPRLPDNQINAVIRSLLEAPELQGRVGGILASEPGQLSFESKDLRLQQAPAWASSSRDRNGFGYFGFWLVQTLVQGGGIRLDRLYQDLQSSVRRETSSRQQPVIFGQKSAAAALILPRVSAAAGMPPLVASTRPFAGGFALQLQQAPCFSARELEMPQALAARLLQPRAGGDLTESWNCLAQAASALADRGQTVVTRYGLGDLLPGDPLKVTDQDFTRAADELRAAHSLFEEALRRLPAAEENAALRAAWEDSRKGIQARVLLCEGVLERSQSKLEQASLLGGRNLPESENALGLLLLEARDYAAAEIHLKTAKTFSPDWMYPRHNLAIGYLERGDYAAAEREYREAIAIAPWQPYLYYNLGLLLQRTNRLREAAREYQRALDAYDRAIALLGQRATEWPPDLAPVAVRRASLFAASRGEVYNAMGSLEEARNPRRGRKGDEAALANYKRALDAKPELCPAYYNAARVTERLGVPDPVTARDAAIGLLLKCPDSKFYPVLPELGRLYLLRERNADALASFRSALNLQPASVPARSGYASALAASGSRDEAAGELVKLLADAGARPELLEQLGDVYAPAQPGRACEQYRQAVAALPRSDYPGNPRLLQQKASRCDPNLQ